MLRRALTTPIRTNDAAGILIIGALVTLLSWTVVPLWLLGAAVAPPLLLAAPLALAPPLVARGYFLRVVADGIADGNAGGAPSFVEWGRLYRDGVRSVLLSAVLLLPLAGLFVLGVAAGVVVELGRVDPTPMVESAAGTAAGDEEATAALIGLVGGLLGVLGLGYLVAFAFIRPAALAVLADTGRLRDALDPREFGSVALSGAYATGWTLAMITLLTGYVLAAPFVPLLVGIGVVFTVRIAAHALYGYGAASSLHTPDDPVASGPATIPLDPTATRSHDDGRPSDDVGPTSTVDGDSHIPEASTVDGGLHVPEAPPTVQTGRSVPLSTDPTGSFSWLTDEVTDPGDDGSDDDATSFEWGPSREEPSSSPEESSSSPEEPTSGPEESSPSPEEPTSESETSNPSGGDARDR